MKRFLVGLVFVAPALVLIYYSTQPQLDPTLQAPLFHFYVVTFTAFAAAVISILLGIALSETAERRHFLAAIAFAAMGSIFFTHGAATPGALIGYVHPVIQWSAWLTLFGGGLLFVLAGFDRPGHTPAWLSLKRLVYLTAGGIFLYIAIAIIAPDWLRFIDANAQPWHQTTIFWVTLALWLVAALRLGQIWRITGSRIDGALCFVAFWLAQAAISMHQFPVWQLSWWLYHFILLVSFLYTVYVLTGAYERARQFSLVRYYMATSLILTVLLALIASHVLAEYLFRALSARQDGDMIEQAVLSARLTGFTMSSLLMSLLFMALLIVVGRADRIISQRTWELSRANADLRRAEGMREDLTNMIVHDLRSPLTAIGGHLELLQRLAGDARAELRARSLAAAQEAVRRMSGMINEMLVVSKIEADQLTLRLEPTSLDTLLKDCLTSFAAQAEADKKQLALDCPPDLTVELDSDLIGRVMDNLISNALKYTNAGGLIHVGVWSNNGQMQVQVRDNGEGIPDAYKQQIFNKYFQALAQDGRAKRQGTGLGLSFCYLVIQAHKGQIWVEDAPGGGSDFKFKIPQKQL